MLVVQWASHEKIAHESFGFILDRRDCAQVGAGSLPDRLSRRDRYPQAEMTERLAPVSARFPFSEPPWCYLTDPDPASFVDAGYSPSTSAAVGGQGVCAIADIRRDPFNAGCADVGRAPDYV